ncbi:MAG: DHA2 family efflux MFS transporter permease subunit, partial [Actinobacteria bacterium]|nr:DHA2 family efflux MFS transporter permease subunit [Actinomycetota bacterium]
APDLTRAYKVLALTAVATFLVSLDISIVVVARRTIEADLGHPTLLTWVFSAYNIAYAAGLLTAGRFADVNGRKRSFLRGLALFSIGSVLCGLAPNAMLLVLARVVQALGGAQLTPASLALVLPEFPVEKRTVAIGIWGAVGGLAAAVGPSAGGVLVDWLNWRALFFINVPFCIFTLIVGGKILHESKDLNATKHVDLIGTALGFPGVALVTLAITQSSDWGWGDNRTLGALIIGFILLALFVQRCNTVTDPLLDLSLLKMPFVVAANLSGLFFSIGFLGMWLLNTQWLQAVWNYSPAMSGLAIAPGPITAAIFAAPMGRLAVQWGHAKVLMVGALCLAFGTAMFSFTIDTTPNYVGGLLPWMILTGFGVGCSMSTLSSAASAFLPPARFAMGSALNTTMRQIGSALGAALAGSLAAPAMKNLVVAMTNKEALTRTMLSSYFTAWRVMAAIYLFAGIVMIVLFRKPTEQQMTDAGQVEFVD